MGALWLGTSRTELATCGSEMPVAARLMCVGGGEDQGEDMVPRNWMEVDGARLIWVSVAVWP